MEVDIDATQVKHNRRILLVASLVLILLFVSILFLGNTLYKQYAPSILSVQTQSSNTLNIYPDPILTPGDIFPEATKEIICVAGYTKTVRNVPLSLKKEVYANYNVPYPQATGSYELDHFIPLALGGSNDKKNLWPEPALPKPGFHEKDAVELYLLDQVCRHGHDLRQAQEEVRKDWYAVYLEIPNKEAYQY